MRVGDDHGRLAASPLRVLVVANRTAATPDLVAAVRKCARERPTVFGLLIPDAPTAEHPDWTLELALSLLERAAGARVTGLTATHKDPFVAVRNVVASNAYERIIASTLPNRTVTRLRRDLPRRLRSLGIPVQVIRPARGKLSDITGPPLMSGCELWLKAAALTEQRQR